jgi:hypothetical protein
MGQARRPPEPGQYRRLTHAHAVATGVTREGLGANLNHGFERSNGKRRRRAARHLNREPSAPPASTGSPPKTPAATDPHHVGCGRGPSFVSHGSATQWSMISKSKQDAAYPRTFASAGHGPRPPKCPYIGVPATMSRAPSRRARNLVGQIPVRVQNETVVSTDIPLIVSAACRTVSISGVAVEPQAEALDAVSPVTLNHYAHDTLLRVDFRRPCENGPGPL